VFEFLFIFCNLCISFYASFTKSRSHIRFFAEACLKESCDGVQCGRGFHVLAADPSTPHGGPGVNTLGRY